MDRIVLTMNRLVIALVVSAGLVASSLLGIFATGGPEILGINALSVIGFLVSGILGFWLLWGVLRSGRL
jgi:ubiquinone biosynthesis protein